MTRGSRVLVQSGGPRWRVLLGRRDGTTANITAANGLPSPFDNLTTLQQKFGAVGLDDTDLVALSGKHKHGATQNSIVILVPLVVVDHPAGREIDELDRDHGHLSSPLVSLRACRGAHVRAGAVPVRDAAAVQLQRDEPAGPDAGQRVPGVPLAAVPEGRGRDGAQRPRPDHAGRLRQQLLHQHRGAPRDAAVGPGAAVDAGRADGGDRRPVRRQPEGVLQELRRVHDQHGEHPGADGEPG